MKTRKERIAEIDKKIAEIVSGWARPRMLVKKIDNEIREIQIK